MEQIGKLIKRKPNQAPKSPEPMAITRQLPMATDFSELVEHLRAAGAPEWEILILQMSQDKRHDLAPHVMPYWREKLKNLPDKMICAALLSGAWQFFPSVDQVLEQVELVAERGMQTKGEAEWATWKAENRRAEKEGRMASEKDYEWARREFREIANRPSIVSPAEQKRKEFVDRKSQATGEAAKNAETANRSGVAKTG